jgi:hypothetical protein
VDDDLYFQAHFSSRSNPIVGVSFSWVGAALFMLFNRGWVQKLGVVLFPKKFHAFKVQTCPVEKKQA